MNYNLFDIEHLADKGPALIRCNQFVDERGSFRKIFSSTELHDVLSFQRLLQVNLSTSKEKGTVRGLHYQGKPYEESKIVFCLSGSINDYLVDLRPNSAFLGRVYKIKVSDTDNTGIFIPKGFAHGFQTLKNNTELIYFHDEIYNRDAEAGLSIFSPGLAIDLDEPVSVISERDKTFPIYSR